MRCLICNNTMRLIQKGLFDDRYGAPGRHNIYRCANCGFGRISPGLSPREIGEFYAKYYPLGATTLEAVKASVSVPPRWQSWLAGTNNIAHQYVRTGQEVLDIGSASGVSLLEIKKLGGIPFGIEPDPNAAKLAKKLKLNVFTGFITDNPFPEKQFDMITASQVLEHASDPEVFLKSVSNRLKPSGVAALSFPNFNAFYRKLCGRRWLHWHIPYHYNFFTKNSFEQLAEEAGLKVTSIRTITPNLWTLIQLRSLLDYPKEGKMGAVWAAQHSKQPARAKHTGVHLIGRLLLLPIALVNRVIDLLGQGESLLVFLQKDKQ